MGYCPVCKSITKFRTMCPMHHNDEKNKDKWKYCASCGGNLHGPFKECMKCKKRFNNST